MSTHNNQGGGRPAPYDDTPPPQLPYRLRSLVSTIDLLPAADRDLVLQQFLGGGSSAANVGLTGYASSVAAPASAAASSARRRPVQPTPGELTPAALSLPSRPSNRAPTSAARATSSLHLNNANDSDVNDDDDAEPAASSKRKANPHASEEQKKKASRKEASNVQGVTTRRGTRRGMSRGKSEREMRLERRNGGGKDNEDEGKMPRRVVNTFKVTNHGVFDPTKYYTDDPRTRGIYVINFESKEKGKCVVALGISVANSRGNKSHGLTGRIRRAHGKLLQGELGGQVTTITGLRRINYHDLELFLLFYPRSPLPRESKKIYSSESFKLDSMVEGDKFIDTVIAICKEVNKNADIIIDDHYSNPSGVKICFAKSSADLPGVVHFTAHPEYTPWIKKRLGKTDQMNAEAAAKRCHLNPGNHIRSIFDSLITYTYPCFSDSISLATTTQRFMAQSRYVGEEA